MVTNNQPPTPPPPPSYPLVDNVLVAMKNAFGNKFNIKYIIEKIIL